MEEGGKEGLNVDDDDVVTTSTASDGDSSEAVTITTTESDRSGQVEDEDFSNLYVCKEKFLSMTPVKSFFASLAVYKKAICTGKRFRYVARNIVRETEVFLNTAMSECSIVCLTDNRRLNQHLLPKFRELFGLAIEIWCPNSRLRTSTPDLDFQAGRQKVHLAQFNDNYVLIADLAMFRKSFQCKFCHHYFSSPRKVTRHLEESCQFVKWREEHPSSGSDEFLMCQDQSTSDLKFVSGKYKARETISDKLDRIGVNCCSAFEPYNRGLAALDIECLLCKMKGGCSSSKQVLTDRHIPISISIASEVPVYELTKTFISTQPWCDFVLEACKYLNRISDRNFTLEKKRHAELLEELTEAARSAENQKKWKFATEIRNIMDSLQDHLRHLPVITFWGCSYDWPLLSRRSGLLYKFYQLDDHLPTVTVRDKNHWIAIKTSKNRCLDACMYLGRTGGLDKFMKNMGVPKDFCKLKFPFKILTDYSKLWSTEFPPLEAFENDIDGSNTLGAEHEMYTRLLKSGKTSDQAMTIMGVKEIPKTAEENWIDQKSSNWDQRKFKYFYEYLAWYNSHDVIGLVYSFNKMRKQFMTVTNIDPLEFSTVSSYGFCFLMKNLAQNAKEDRNYLCLLDRNTYDMLQRGLIGGVSLSFDRLSIAGYSKIRPHVMGPHAKTVQKNVLLDVKAMYPSATRELTCCCLGFYSVRCKANNFEADTLMDRLVISMTWLYFVARVIEQKFMRTRLSFNGEKAFTLKKGRIKVDGSITLTSYFPKEKPRYKCYEFNGCLHHGHAASPEGCALFADKNGINPLNGKTFAQLYGETMERLHQLQELNDVDSVTVMWECTWRNRIKTDGAVNQFSKQLVHSLLPDPITHSCDWTKMNELICTSQVSGFVECDLEVPENDIERFEYYLPPFFKKKSFSQELLPDPSVVMSTTHTHTQ